MLKRYVSQFDPSIIALRGSPEELAAVYQAYHVDVIKDEAAAGSSGYPVGHSALVYVIDKGDCGAKTWTRTRRFRIS